MADLTRHILGLLDQSPKAQERVAQALHVEPHPTGAGMAHLNMRQRDMLFQWHPHSQTVYYIEPPRDGRKNGRGIRIATDIVTHGDAINTMLIWIRGRDYERDQHTSRPDLVEGT